MLLFDPSMFVEFGIPKNHLKSLVSELNPVVLLSSLKADILAALIALLTASSSVAAIPLPTPGCA